MACFHSPFPMLNMNASRRNKILQMPLPASLQTSIARVRPEPKSAGLDSVAPQFSSETQVSPLRRRSAKAPCGQTGGTLVIVIKDAASAPQGGPRAFWSHNQGPGHLLSHPVSAQDLATGVLQSVLAHLEKSSLGAASARCMFRSRQINSADQLVSWLAGMAKAPFAAMAVEVLTTSALAGEAVHPKNHDARLGLFSQGPKPLPDCASLPAQAEPGPLNAHGNSNGAYCSHSADVSMISVTDCRRFFDSLSDVASLKDLLSELERSRELGMGIDERLWLDRACELLGQEGSVGLNYRTLAAKLGVSYEVFRHRFRRLTGTAPRRYRQFRLMQAACRFLCTTRCTIAEIALKLGFCDEFHFSRSFKKVVGQNPRAFRQQFLAASP